MVAGDNRQNFKNSKYQHLGSVNKVTKKNLASKTKKFDYTTTPHRGSIILILTVQQGVRETERETSESCLDSSHKTSASEMPS